MKKFTSEELQTIVQFLHDNDKSKGLSDKQALSIEALCDEYHKGYTALSPTTSIVSCKMGTLGCIRIQSIKEVEMLVSDTNWITYRANTDTRILFTDYSNEEPYNRHDGLYAFGASWQNLTLVNTTPDYREFTGTQYCYHISSCELRPFYHNTFWGTVSFDIVVDNSKVEEFVAKLRVVLRK